MTGSLFHALRDGREGMVAVVDYEGHIVGSMGVETWAKVRSARCQACEEGVPLVNVTADRSDLPDTWTHQYGGEPGTISPCTRLSSDAPGVCPVDGTRECDPICSGCESFLAYAVRMYVQVGEELYELPDRAWLRRRKAWKWRQHYAMRIADEMEARHLERAE